MTSENEFQAVGDATNWHWSLGGPDCWARPRLRLAAYASAVIRPTSRSLVMKMSAQVARRSWRLLANPRRIVRKMDALLSRGQSALLTEIPIGFPDCLQIIRKGGPASSC